tara:strand:+ start:162 stop:641 length:480 start_codon:yes stop_codon:yes gene_type:complete
MAQRLNGWGRSTWGDLAFGEGDLPVNVTAPGAATSGFSSVGVNAQAIAVLPSVSATLGSGISVLVDGEANVNPTGQAGTSALGTISLVTNNNVSVSGFSAPASTGIIITDAEAVITLTILTEMTSTLGLVQVYGLIDTSQTPNYSIITDTQTPNWEEVA